MCFDTLCELQLRVECHGCRKSKMQYDINSVPKIVHNVHCRIQSTVIEIWMQYPVLQECSLGCWRKLIFFPFFFVLLHPCHVLIQSFQSIYNILKWAFIIFPQFCLGQGLIELSYNQIKFDLTRNFGIDSYVSPFEMDFLGWIFVEMSLQGTLLLLLRLFLHWDLLWKTRCVIICILQIQMWALLLCGHWTNVLRKKMVCFFEQLKRNPYASMVYLN